MSTANRRRHWPTSANKRSSRWKIAGQEIAWGSRPLVMGILNVTPDSFSDGGLHLQPEQALQRARRMVEAGADIIDVGGESTRPGAGAVAASEELRRVMPVVKVLASLDIGPISVDTRKAVVARRAVDAGAAIINDVSSMADPEMADVVRQTGAGLVLMHMRGEPVTMQQQPSYGDVTAEVCDFLRTAANTATKAGIDRDSLLLDPGLGFGKRTGGGIEDNIDLLANLGHVVELGFPVLVGASRKRFLANVAGDDPGSRLHSSVAAAVIAVLGGASAVRVHDVAATRAALDVVAATRAIRQHGPQIL